MDSLTQQTKMALYKGMNVEYGNTTDKILLDILEMLEKIEQNTRKV